MNRLDHLCRTQSLEDLVRLGLEDTAYIKPMMFEGQRIYIVHAADGTPLMMAPAYEVALAAVRQHDMEPVSIH